MITQRTLNETRKKARNRKGCLATPVDRVLDPKSTAKRRTFDKIHWEITHMFRNLGGYWDKSQFYEVPR
jgi:hypothetical protein